MSKPHSPEHDQPQPLYLTGAGLPALHPRMAVFEQQIMDFLAGSPISGRDKFATLSQIFEETCRELFGQRFDTAGRADIAVLCAGFYAGIVEVKRSLLQRSLIDIGDQNIRALSSKCKCKRAAHTTGAASNHRQLAVKVLHVELLFG